MKTLFVTLCLCAAWDSVNCQKVNEGLQPWLVGIIAVTVFLALAIIASVINKLCCQDKKDSKKMHKQESMNGNTNDFSIYNEGTYSPTAEDFRFEEGPHSYENKAEFGSNTWTKHHTENHSDFGFQCDTTTACHSESSMTACHSESSGGCCTTEM